MEVSIAMTSSLTLMSLVPKTLTQFATKPASISLSLSSLRSGLVCVASSGLRGLSRPTFFANVSVLSKFEKDEEVLKGENNDFLPDLKLFIGTLPFSINNAQLAGLFKRASNVKMVEI